MCTRLVHQNSVLAKVSSGSMTFAPEGSESKGDLPICICPHASRHLYCNTPSVPCGGKPDQRGAAAPLAILCQHASRTLPSVHVLSAAGAFTWPQVVHRYSCQSRLFAAANKTQTAALECAVYAAASNNNSKQNACQPRLGACKASLRSPGRLALSDLTWAGNRQVVNVRQDHIISNLLLLHPQLSCCLTCPWLVLPCGPALHASCAAAGAALRALPRNAPQKPPSLPPAPARQCSEGIPLPGLEMLLVLTSL